MKAGIFGGLLVGGTILVANTLIGSAPANATPGEDNYQFVQMLNNDGIHVTNLSAALSSAHQVCRNIYNGATGTSETSRVYYSTDSSVTPSLAKSFVWDSVIVFCPQYLPGGSQNPV